MCVALPDVCGTPDAVVRGVECGTPRSGGPRHASQLLGVRTRHRSDPATRGPSTTPQHPRDVVLPRHPAHDPPIPAMDMARRRPRSWSSSRCFVDTPTSCERPPETRDVTPPASRGRAMCTLRRDTSPRVAPRRTTQTRRNGPDTPKRPRWAASHQARDAVDHRPTAGDQLSSMVILVIETGSSGRSCAPVRAVAMASTTSSPEVSLPKMV